MSRAPRSPSRPRAKPARPGPPARRSVHRLEQVRILAHPVRLHLLELFAEAPRTTKQAADRLGLPATRLYHHVAALERVGLVRVRETRRNRGTIEKHYEAVAPGFELDPADLVRGRGKAARQAASRLASEGMAALALRIVERAHEGLVAALDVAAREELSPEDPRCPIALRAGIFASPERVAAMRKELLALVESWAQREEAEGAGTSAGTARAWLTIVFVPEPTG